MKLIDEKGKLFGKINIVDFCVIILVIVLAGGAFYKFRVLDKTNNKAATVPISYTVQVKRVRDYVYSNVKEGDILLDKVSGNPIGKIVKIEGTPSVEPVLCSDGIYRTGTVENRVDVIFTVDTNGTVSDSGVYVNRTYELLSGSERKFMTKYFECDGRIKDIL